MYEMIELIHSRHSERDGHAMDVLMEALRKQRVQAHIARELQRALARAKDQRRGIYSQTVTVGLESFGDVFPLQEMEHLVQCLPNLTPQLTSPHVRQYSLSHVAFCCLLSRSQTGRVLWPVSPRQDQN